MTEPINLHEKCAQCGHAWSFHQKAFGATCLAMGCKGGEDNQRCTGFVRTEVSTCLSGGR